MNEASQLAEHETFFDLHAKTMTSAARRAEADALAITPGSKEMCVRIQEQERGQRRRI